MIGQTLGHYRILEKIGAGGMGEVYRARDERLERDVALKVLPTGALADEVARKRFRKEALALSKLNHPNIQTVHDFDTQEGVDFLVVEFVPGPTLADKLAGGALSEKEVIGLGQQTVAALEEAHEHGVIHRDLKPANIKLTFKGQVKVLDFGLAKLLRPFSQAAPTESLTETRAAAGTLPYMAPEQLRGEGVDHRTDIWAAGAVLYELATGQRAFREELTPRLTDTILHESPVAPRALNPRVSTELERIILKCLEKEPESRYQSAKELGVDLRRLGAPALGITPRREPGGSVWEVLRRRWVAALVLATVPGLLVVLLALNVGGLRERVFRTGTPKIDSLAVLPLKNLMRDPEQDYFVEGMHEALITELSKIGALKVISRTSTLRYKDTDKAMPQIARELGVTGLIEGSVLREGDQVRITVQLIHGPTDRHLWAQSFDRQLRAILALQSEVAGAIANEIKVKLTPQEQTQLARARPVNPEAHELYLRGRYAWDKFTVDGFQQARGYFEQATQKDPGYALAFTGLADTYAQLSGRVLPAREAMPKVRHAALKALELDPNLGEAHSSLAYVIHYYEWNWADAEKEYKRSMELNPGSSLVHGVYAFYLSSLSQFDKSLAEMNRAQELDPLFLGLKCGESRLLYYARRYDQATEVHRKMAELDPALAGRCFWLVPAYEQKGMVTQAVSLAQTSVSGLAGETLPMAMLGGAYALSGRKRDAADVLRELVALSKERFVSPYDMAVLCVRMGDRDRAIEWLQKAVEERSGLLVYLNVEPIFDPLRDDPRFQALLRRMKFPE